MCGGVHTKTHVWRSRKTCKSQFSPFIMLFLGIELRSLGLASVYYCEAISSALCILLNFICLFLSDFPLCSFKTTQNKLPRGGIAHSLLGHYSININGQLLESISHSSCPFPEDSSLYQVDKNLTNWLLVNLKQPNFIIEQYALLFLFIAKD